MRYLLIALFLLTSGLATAQSVQDQIVSQLTAQGFTRIEVSRTLLGRIKIDAKSATLDRELVFNPVTGEILRDYWHDNTPAANAPRVLIPRVDDRNDDSRTATSASAGSGRGSSGSGRDDGKADNDRGDDDRSGRGGGDDRAGRDDHGSDDDSGRGRGRGRGGDDGRDDD